MEPITFLLCSTKEKVLSEIKCCRFTFVFPKNFPAVTDIIVLIDLRLSSWLKESQSSASKRLVSSKLRACLTVSSSSLLLSKHGFVLFFLRAARQNKTFVMISL